MSLLFHTMEVSEEMRELNSSLPSLQRRDVQLSNTPCFPAAFTTVFKPKQWLFLIYSIRDSHCLSGAETADTARALRFYTSH